MSRTKPLQGTGPSGPVARVDGAPLVPALKRYSVFWWGQTVFLERAFGPI
jgi:hypothetical protein